MAEQIKTFLSYSHKDKEWKEIFVSHLHSLIRTEDLTLWTDDEIEGGREWNGNIAKNLVSSELILLLISPDFIESNYCYNIELKKAVEMHDQRKAVVVPVGLRSVDIENTSFAKLQMLPSDPRFVSSWSNRDEAFTNVIKGIRKTITCVISELKNWNPIARKDVIRRMIENASYEEACNKLIDFVEDFSENDDLKDTSSKIKSDFMDVKIMREKSEKEKKELDFYDRYRKEVRSIKEAIFQVIRQVLEEQKVNAA